MTAAFMKLPAKRQHLNYYKVIKNKKKINAKEKNENI
jgi:hypothetical protein